MNHGKTYRTENSILYTVFPVTLRIPIYPLSSGRPWPIIHIVRLTLSKSVLSNNFVLWVPTLWWNHTLQTANSCSGFVLAHHFNCSDASTVLEQLFPCDVSHIVSYTASCGLRYQHCGTVCCLHFSLSSLVVSYPHQTLWSPGSTCMWLHVLWALPSDGIREGVGDDSGCS